MASGNVLYLVRHGESAGNVNLGLRRIVISFSCGAEMAPRVHPP
jgi:hypothetical protein